MEKSALAGVDVNLLVALDALVAEGHVGRAARRVGLSASAMSHALSRLRGLVGDPILVRAGPRMTLSARGKELAGPVREGLALLERAVRAPAPFDPRAEKRILRLAAIDFAQNHLVAPFLGRLREQAPGVDVSVDAFEPRVFKDLAAGDVDLVLGLWRQDSALRARVLREEPFVSVVRQGHPALGRPMTAKAFAALSHALISTRGRRTGAVDRKLEEAGLSRRVALVVPSFTAAAIAVARSDMVLTGARSEAERVRGEMGLAMFDPPVAIAPFRVAMFWHERQEHDRFLTWARDEMVRASAPPPGRRAKE